MNNTATPQVTSRFHHPSTPGRKKSNSIHFSHLVFCHEGNTLQCQNTTCEDLRVSYGSTLTRTCLRTCYVLADPPQGRNVRLPTMCNLASRRRCSKGCDWPANVNPMQNQNRFRTVVKRPGGHCVASTTWNHNCALYSQARCLSAG